MGVVGKVLVWNQTFFVSRTSVPQVSKFLKLIGEENVVGSMGIVEKMLRTNMLRMINGSKDRQHLE